MIDRLKTILSESSCDGWKLTVKEIEGAQGYFILDRKEMMRAQNAVEAKLIVYKDYYNEGERYRGSMGIELFPTMTDIEIIEKINLAVTGASAIKNRWYPLLSPKTHQVIQSIKPVSQFDTHEVIDWIRILADDVYRHHRPEVDFNATEIFLSKERYRFLNSEGLEHSWVAYAGMIQLVTTVKGADEEVELFDLFSFSDYSRQRIDQKIEQQIDSVIDRAVSIPLPVLREIPVILKRAAVPEFFDYFRYKSSAEAVFQGTSDYRKGKSILTGKGDPLNITITPFIMGSPRNSTVDADGIVPEDVHIIENSTVKHLVADIQFGTYLTEHITGVSSNIKVLSGSMKSSDFGNSPYLETVEFSDFTVDRITGDFGGEIRLGYYYDGTKRIPVTGGSITGKIENVINTMRMSDTTITYGSYSGPDFLFLPGVNITGIKAV